MPLEVVCDRPSRTARELQELLLADPLTQQLSGRINWTGAPLAEALNAKARTNKLAQLIRLELKGVSVPRFSLSPEAGWFGRTLLHQQGRDFTTPPLEPDFWVQRLPLREEWRVHLFRTKRGNIRLLRSGVKLPKHGRAHPWVRSHRLGWKISYTGGAPEDAVRISRAAVAALELDFAAVDVGLTGEGVDGMMDCYVLEANTCPGLDTGTLALYANSIKERLS